MVSKWKLFENHKTSGKFYGEKNMKNKHNLQQQLNTIKKIHWQARHIHTYPPNLSKFLQPRCKRSPYPPSKPNFKVVHVASHIGVRPSVNTGTAWAIERTGRCCYDYPTSIQPRLVMASEECQCQTNGRHHKWEIDRLPCVSLWNVTNRYQ